MTVTVRTVTLLVGVLVGLSPAAAQISLPAEYCLACSLSQQRLFNDLADRRLDEHTILAAALIAADAQETQIAECLHSARQRCDAWRARGLVVGPDRQRAETLFRLMHAEMLTSGYHPDASSLAEAVLHGRFNCLSATLLWQYLATEFQLTAVASQLPGHLRSVLVDGASVCNVETTCPDWFARIHVDGSPRGEIAAWQGMPNRDHSYLPTRDLDDAGLIAAVYYNHGLALLAAKQYAQALAATHAAHRLDPDYPAAKANLLATLNNWALHLASEGQTARAVAILQTGQAIAPEHDSFAINLEVLGARRAPLPVSSTELETPAGPSGIR